MWLQTRLTSLQITHADACLTNPPSLPPSLPPCQMLCTALRCRLGEKNPAFILFLSGSHKVHLQMFFFPFLVSLRLPLWRQCLPCVPSTLSLALLSTFTSTHPPPSPSTWVTSISRSPRLLVLPAMVIWFTPSAIISKSKKEEREREDQLTLKLFDDCTHCTIFLGRNS